MKNCAKILSITSLFLMLFLSAWCQPYQKGTLSMSIAGEILFAENPLSQSHHTGPGATLKGEYVFGKHTTATLVSGYYLMKRKNSQIVTQENISAVPIKAGLRYYLGNFYGAGEFGGIFSSGFAQNSGYLYSVGIGDKFTIQHQVFDVAVRHESWTFGNLSRSIIGVRIGYEFAVNRSPKSAREVSL